MGGNVGDQLAGTSLKRRMRSSTDGTVGMKMSGNNADGVAGAELTDFTAELSHFAERASTKLSSFDVGERGLPLSIDHVNQTTTSHPHDDFNRLIMDIPVTIKVVLGTARMPVAAISKLARGSIVKLESRVGDPVDIVVNGRLLARGEVVVLDEGQSRFGVKLTEVGETKDKMR
jgi:flagellar motor switch protein FliN/FliY